MKYKQRIKFNCKNKGLEAVIYSHKNYSKLKEEVWEIRDGKKWIDSVDYCKEETCSESLKFYHSTSGKNFKDIKELINFWKKRYIFPNLGRNGKSGEKRHKNKVHYSLDIYEISKKDFEQLLVNVKKLLNSGAVVHYNDEHGVGYFEKGKVKGKYLTTHWRHYCKNTENLTIEKIGEFLRSFFDIGYSHTQVDNW